MRTIIVVIYVFLFLILGLPVLGIEWIIAKFDKHAADISQLRIVQWGLRCVSFLAGVHLTVEGKEHVPTDQAVLYIGNHRSIFDIVITYAQCPNLTGYISKDGVNKVPLLGIWMRRLYCLFLDRKDLKQGLKTILTAIDQVKSGISICIFPEGTRNPNEDITELLPFKEGSLKIAEKSGCPVVPVAISGARGLFEAHGNRATPGSIHIRILPPIRTVGMSKAEQKIVDSYEGEASYTDTLARHLIPTKATLLQLNA